VNTSIFIDSHKIWSVPICWKVVAFVFYAARVISIVFICEIQRWMWKYDLTSRADCIRLLAGRGMNICHQVWSLRTVIPIKCKTNTKLPQSGNLSKLQHMVLTLPIRLLFLGQWNNTCEVTNSAARRIQDPNFCNDNCKKTCQDETSVSGCCGNMSKK
jgi:hypothetical protein